MSIAESRKSCRKARLDAGIKLPADRIDAFLSALSEPAFTRLKFLHGVSFPLTFPTLSSEINFLSVLSLLNAFSGYRALFHEKTGEGVYQNVVRLLMGLYISDGNALSSKGLAGLSARTVAGIWGVELMSEKQHATIPGLSIMEKGGEMSEVVDLVVEACQETGGILTRLGFSSLGDWVLHLLRRMDQEGEDGDDLAKADTFVSELASTFPAFNDVSSPTIIHPYPIPIYKRIYFLLFSLHQRLSPRLSHNATEGESGQTSIPAIPDPIVLPMFVDNVLPTMSVHHGLLDLSECKVDALREWGARAERYQSQVQDKSRDEKAGVEPGPELSKEEAYTIRAATLDMGQEVVRRARELASTPGTEWTKDMTEADLDGYLWSVAKDDPVLRRVPRTVEKRTVMY